MLWPVLQDVGAIAVNKAFQLEETACWCPDYAGECGRVDPRQEVGWQ